ncbi:MAG: PKD domain-containing protein [Bacteroidota bacterium]|nr:MAG: PKD domain-containing protein [Bacteroidota bacterium]
MCRPASYFKFNSGGNTNGFTYLWSDGITTRRDTILASATAVYSVLVTNASGCSNSDTLTLVVNPATVGNFGYVQNGNTITLTDSTQNSTAWSWDFGDGNQSTNQNPVYTYSTSGNFTITLIVTGPCGNDTITKAIGIWPESVQSVHLSAIQLYPNPATSEVVISALQSGDLLQEVQLSICKVGPCGRRRPSIAHSSASKQDTCQRPVFDKNESGNRFLRYNKSHADVKSAFFKGRTKYFTTSVKFAPL